ncbi:MAG TPA: amidohydrolase [Bacteroidales bacterium]|nr:amidohydrolase [Bacteroidales bacterium]
MREMKKKCENYFRKSLQITAAFFILTIYFTQSVHAQFTDMKKILAQVTDNYEGLETIYKDLHMNPELSGMEKNTSEKIKTELIKYGYEVKDKIGGFGVVGILRNGPGKTIMFRTDMDALPIEEKTGLQYASKTKSKDKNGKEVSVMHACGHDMHMTNFLGTAQALANFKSEWSGTVIFVAQPAEENGTGAKAMLDAGLFAKYPVPDYILAVHLSAELESGKIGVIQGPAFAGADNMEITVYGQGGHGGFPHKTIDPVLLSAELVIALQTLISRELDVATPAVISVGAINGGFATNIIPDEVVLKVTMRTYSKDVREFLLKRIEQITAGLASAKGLPKEKFPKIDVYKSYIPPVYNDPELTADIEKHIINAIGKSSVIKVMPIMASEDFSIYGNNEVKIPSTLIWLGGVPESVIKKYQTIPNQMPGLHSPYFYPDISNTIKTGIRATTSAILGMLKVEPQN